VQRSSRCTAEPGPTLGQDGPRLSSAALHAALRPGNVARYSCHGRGAACPASLRRQSRHRQSSPASTTIGRRTASSAHQHDSVRLQLNSVPHPEQARRRDAGSSNRFVMIRTGFGRVFSCRVHVERRYDAQRNLAPGTVLGKPDGPRFASRPGRAQSLRLWRAWRGVGRSGQCGVRSARLCQSRTEPPQRGAARSAGIAVDAGIGRSGVRLSSRGQAGARGGGEIGRAGIGVRTGTTGG
jgi:hypothetical protein